MRVGQRTLAGHGAGDDGVAVEAAVGLSRCAEPRRVSTAGDDKRRPYEITGRRVPLGGANAAQSGPLADSTNTIASATATVESAWS